MKDLILGLKLFRFSYKWKVNLGVSLFYLLFSLSPMVLGHDGGGSFGALWSALPCMLLIQACYTLCGMPLIQTSPMHKRLLVRGTTGLLWTGLMACYSIGALGLFIQFQKGRFDMEFIKMQLLLFLGMTLMIILYMPLVYRKPIAGYLILGVFVFRYSLSNLQDSEISFSGWLGDMNIRTVFVMGYVLIFVLVGLHYLISLMTWRLPFSQSIMNRFFRPAK